jgi:hypothetical protein
VIRHFCDLCGDEIHAYLGGNRVTHRIRRSLEAVHVEVTVGVVKDRNVGPTWNGGHVCTACVMKVVERGADL